MENADVETHHSARLYAEQVDLLYKNAPLAYSITLINGALLAFVQSAYIALPVVLAWYSILVLVTAVRGLLARKYAQARSGVRGAKRWNAVYAIGAFCAGSVWGAAGLALFPTESIAHQVFIAFVLGGMSAGGINVLAYRMEACLAFLLPILLPLAVRYLALGTPLHLAMGVMTLLFLVGMWVSALNFHRSIRTSLKLRFDKRELEEEIVRRNRAEEALLLEKHRLQTVLAAMGEGVALIDFHGRIEYLNSVAEDMCGWSSDSALHRPAKEVFQGFEMGCHRPTSLAMEDCLHAAEPVKKQTVMIHRSGKECCIEELATPLFDPHRHVVGAVSILHDVTEMVQRTEELVYLADHDALTGLPNRNLLNNRLVQAIARAQRKHESFALLFLDLDRFKEINDSMGHAAGDAVLIGVAKRLLDSVREEDTIARLGGDEFVALLEGPIHDGQAKAIVDKIYQRLCEPHHLDGQDVVVTASIGASLFPSDGADPESLLVSADAAMYRAKQDNGH